MKSAEEILREHSSVCPKFPDPTCDGCMCNADLAAIRSAQREAAEAMREEIAALADNWGDAELAEEIRNLKLPGEE